MPDFDLRPRASFISSKDGETPPSPSRSLMKSRSSYCLRVSIYAPCARPPGPEQNTNINIRSSLVHVRRQAFPTKNLPLLKWARPATNYQLQTASYRLNEPPVRGRISILSSLAAAGAKG